MNMANVNVEKLMKLQGDMTDAQFAKELGVSRTQLWRVRNGYSVPGPGFLQKFKARYPTERIDDYFFANDVPSIAQLIISETARVKRKTPHIRSTGKFIRI